MNYKLAGMTPMLETKDLANTLKFYTEKLSFVCDNYSEEWGWAHLHKDDVKIMFSAPNAHRNLKEPVMSGSLYMNTEDVDTLWEALKADVKICYPIEDFEYGMREFAIYDNNGYIIQFGKSIS